MPVDDDEFDGSVLESSGGQSCILDILETRADMGRGNRVRVVGGDEGGRGEGGSDYQGPNLWIPEIK